ncbi:peroxiredoxin family protein [Luteolibacter marinus]|uniref:peroxiredoxin family protein n=1 Tax=Luteolibacter marinus TaxID=2776705 RepID=UPI001865C17B|nr:peroxiredoxin family protein [Luteolibacter marinus]
MRLSLLMVSVLAGGVISAVAGTPKQADGIRRAYEADFKAWVLKLQVAPDAATRKKIAAERPDAAAAAARMWSAIRPNLAEEWTLDPAAWILMTKRGQMTRDAGGNVVPVLGEASQVIGEAVVKYHLKSPNLADMCMAQVAAADANSLPLLERIEQENPDKKVQGVAALGIAMLLKDLSDEPEVMRRRLTMLRKAIIESSEVEINGVEVAKLAENELYIIRHLSKGRQAPELEGQGSGGQAMKLSDYQGKVVVLLFWRSDEGNTDQLIEMTRRMRERFAGKPFEIVGVNRDPQATLRSMQASGEIAWPNFSDPEGKLAEQYRVGAWPLAYVLDGERKIGYAGPMGSFVELTAAALIQGE